MMMKTTTGDLCSHTNTRIVDKVITGGSQVFPEISSSSCIRIPSLRSVQEAGESFQSSVPDGGETKYLPTHWTGQKSGPTGGTEDVSGGTLVEGGARDSLLPTDRTLQTLL